MYNESMNSPIIDNYNSNFKKTFYTWIYINLQFTYENNWSLEIDPC